LRIHGPIGSELHKALESVRYDCAQFVEMVDKNYYYHTKENRYCNFAKAVSKMKVSFENDAAIGSLHTQIKTLLENEIFKHESRSETWKNHLALILTSICTEKEIILLYILRQACIAIHTKFDKDFFPYKLCYNHANHIYSGLYIPKKESKEEEEEEESEIENNYVNTYERFKRFSQQKNEMVFTLPNLKFAAALYCLVANLHELIQIFRFLNTFTAKQCEFSL
jgi:hypothetical protein